MKKVEKNQNKLIKKLNWKIAFNFFSAFSDNVKSLSSSAIVLAKSSVSSLSQVLKVNE